MDAVDDELPPETPVVWVRDPEPGDRGLVVDQVDDDQYVVTMNGNNTFVTALTSFRPA